MLCGKAKLVVGAEVGASSGCCVARSPLDDFNGKLLLIQQLLHTLYTLPTHTCCQGLRCHYSPLRSSISQNIHQNLLVLQIGDFLQEPNLPGLFFEGSS